MRIKIRLANKKDEIFLRNIRNENRDFFIHTKVINFSLHHKWFLKRLKSKELIFIAIQNNQRIGTISLLNINMEKEMCELGRFIICKSFRHKGIGHQMLDMFKKVCKLIGVKKIRLNVKKNNKYAFNFYIKENFKTIERKNNKILMGLKI